MLNIILLLINCIFMISNYYERNYKGAIINSFAFGFVSSTLMYQLLNLL
jgi:hypothetical protein